MAFAIKVKFDESQREYCYLCHNPSVMVGDRVIVDSPSTGYTTVTVTDVNPKVQSTPRKDVVAIIDDREYKERLACKRRLDEIEKEIEDRRKHIKVHMVDALLQQDPETQRLKAEREVLENGNKTFGGVEFRPLTDEEIADFIGNLFR